MAAEAAKTEEEPREPEPISPPASDSPAPTGAEDQLEPRIWPGPEEAAPASGAEETAGTEEARGEEVPAEEPSEPEAEFSPQLLARAAAWGLPEAAARRFGSPEDLEQTIQQWAFQEGQSLLARTLPGQPRPPAAPVAAAAQSGAAEEYQPPKLENAGDYPQELVDWMKYHGEYIRRLETKAQQLRQTVQTLSSTQQERENAHLEAEYDQWVETLGEEGVELFGKGPSANLLPNSAEYQNRVAVAKSAAATRWGYLARDIEPPPVSELCNGARAMVFGDHAKRTVKTKAREEIAETLQKRAKTASPRPTERRGRAEMTPRDRAVSVVSDKYREMTGEEPPPEY